MHKNFHQMTHNITHFQFLFKRPIFQELRQVSPGAQKRESLEQIFTGSIGLHVAQPTASDHWKVAEM